MALSRIALAVTRRKFSTSVAQFAGVGGIPGSTLPFSTRNKWRTLVGAAIFFGSGFSLPFVLLRHQLLKQ